MYVLPLRSARTTALRNGAVGGPKDLQAVGLVCIKGILIPLGLTPSIFVQGSEGDPRQT